MLEIKHLVGGGEFEANRTANHHLDAFSRIEKSPSNQDKFITATRLEGWDMSDVNRHRGKTHAIMRHPDVM